MQDFPANSQKAKATAEPREKLAPVTSAEAVRRKQGLGRQFKETFFNGSAREALSFSFTEVVVPAIQDMFAEFLHTNVDRMVHGERIRSRRGFGPLGSMGGGVGPQVSYNRMYPTTQSQTPQQPRTLSRRARARHDLAELIIPSRQEAEEVIDRLFDLLSQYGVATVADLYELTGIQSQHTDMKWGWNNLRGAKAIHRPRQGGYLLDLPEPEAIG